MRKKLVVLGGGGLGREIVYYLMDSIEKGHVADAELVGVADQDPNCEVARTTPSCRFLGTIDDLVNNDDYSYITAIASPKVRRVIAQRFANQNFFSYIHPSSTVARDAIIGDGAIVGPGAVVNSGARLGKCCLVNVLCSIGHGAVVGDFSVLSPYSALNGNSEIGNSCFLGTRATIFPGVKIGDHCIVDTHSYVKANVGDRKIISARGRYDVLDNRLRNDSE